MKKQYLLSILVLTGFLAIGLTAAGCSGKKDLTQEISGVWQDDKDNGTVEISLTGDAKTITVQGKSFPVIVESIEKDKKKVNLKVQNGGVEPELWTLRQIWDDNGSSFTIALHQNGKDKMLTPKKQS